MAVWSFGRGLDGILAGLGSNVVANRAAKSQRHPCLGPSWARLGPVLALCWGVLRPRWAQDGSSWAHLGPCWAALGPSWRARRGMLRQTLGLEAPSSSLHVARRPHAKNIKKTLENQCFTMIFGGRGLRGSVLNWSAGGNGRHLVANKAAKSQDHPFLGPSWAHLGPMSKHLVPLPASR